MYSFISPTGDKITTSSIREFADRYGFKYHSACALHCGRRSRINGFCSTSPKAKKERDRFMTVLVNTRTGERSVLGSSITSFAKKHGGLCANEIWKLVNGHRLIYRHWCLEKSLEEIAEVLTDRNL